MEAIKKEITFKKLLEIKTGIEELRYDRKNRFALSLWQLIEYMKYPIEQYNKKVTALNQKLASTDQDGNFYLDEKGNPIYTKFTREKSIERGLEIEKLMGEIVEIEVKYCEDLKPVKELNVYFVKIFNGLLYELTDKEIENLIFEEEKVDSEKKEESLKKITA